MKYIQLTGQLNYINSLRDLVYNYNHTYNSSIYGTPYEVLKNEHKRYYIRKLKVREAMESIHRTKDKINVGDYVRILLTPDKFTKENQYYSDKVYEVVDSNAFTFILQDETGKKLPLKYRYFQLQKIDKVLKPSSNDVNISKEYKQARKEYRSDYKLKHEEGLDKSNIIHSKRTRKQRTIYNVS
jgi:hypothetical protein